MAWVLTWKPGLRVDHGVDEVALEVDAEEGDPGFVAPLREAGGELGARSFLLESEARHPSRHAQRFAVVTVADLALQRLRHGAALLEDRTQRAREPAVDRALQQLAGVEEQQQHRHQGEADVGRYQLGLETRPEGALAALEPETQEVPGEDEEDDQDEQRVGVDQDEQQHFVGDQHRGQVAPALDEVVNERENGEHQDESGGDVAPVLSVLREELADVHAPPLRAPARAAGPCWTRASRCSADRE